MIKNKIPHIGAPYETNRSKIGSKLAELLRFRLSQDVTTRTTTTTTTSGTHTVREVRPGIKLALDIMNRNQNRLNMTLRDQKNYHAPNFIQNSS